MESSTATELDDVLAQPRLGLALRALREDRGLNRVDVAREAGLSSSFLALVETGRSDLSIGRLAKLLRCYGVHLHDLVPSPSAETVVIRRGEGHFQQTIAAEGVEGVLLAPDYDRKMMPVMVTYAAGARMVDLPTMQRESFFHVLDGDLTIELTTAQSLVLGEGDSVYLKRGDAVCALASDAGARALIVIDPPTL